MRKKTDVRLSPHALERAHEVGLSKDQAIKFFLFSKRYFLSGNHHQWKKQKYGFTYKGIEYYSYAPDNIIFTAKRINKRVVHIITITKRIYEEGKYTVVRS